MTAREVVKQLKADGWYLDRQSKHPIYCHPTKPGAIAVPAHAGKDIPIGTLNEIFKQAGWRKP